MPRRKEEMMTTIKTKLEVLRQQVLVAAIGDVAAGRGASHALEEAERAEANREAQRDTLPTDMGENRPIFEAMGIRFGESLPLGGRVADVHPDGDPLFVRVVLPLGWKKQPTNHAMYTDLVDDKGRKRALIFYKSAFYDRSAHARPLRRFSVTGNYCDEDHQKWAQGLALDGKAVIWKSERVRITEANEYDKTGRDWVHLRDALTRKAADWLDEKYPDWENPLAYWDEPDAADAAVA